MGLGRWVCDSASHNNNNKYNYPDYDDIDFHYIDFHYVDINDIVLNQHCAKHYRSIEVR